MKLPLSVLDLVPLGEGVTSTAALAASVELARRVEALGYTRLWYAEHHNMPGIATTTPELLIAHVGAATGRIRLGAGGVMLPNHSPLKVAESYRLLEAMHPGRIDLGIGRAPGTDGVTALALRRSRQALGADDFVDELAELIAYGAGTMPAAHPFSRIRAMPDDVRLPPIWLLGSSDYSARLAAELGLGYAFAGHFSPDAPEPPMHDYRARFRPGPLDKPHAILALSVFCADTDAAAERMAASMRVAFAELRAGRPGRLPRPDDALAHTFAPDEQATVAFYERVQIVGTPDAVAREIEARARRSAADEVMV
ncbi:MAG TPA: LLM class flavin-dependent oxidoreductase, partial [Ideonella sp.]|nr:LLM class flavin-dependent oxidoreductase [Ideonella sp.]